MILKKPYAFLIKHFKLIHLILALGLIYLAIKFNGLIVFFNDAFKNNYYTGINNVANTAINFYMYLVVLLVLALGIIIYILFKQKEKPKKFYAALIIYYIIIFVLFTFFLSVINNMKVSVIEVKTLKAYRDIILLLSFPQYFFLVMTFIRGIGFDYKKFNFSKDISELKIDVKDSEEFELNVNVEGYKLRRKIRRFLRELKYYTLENAFLVTVLGAILIIIIVTTILLNINIYGKVYKKQQPFTVNGFKINVLDSIITPYSYGGKVITKDKYYLVVLYNVENTYGINQALHLNDFRLTINKENIFPAVNNREFFIDIGEAYYENKLKPRSNKNITMIYELTKDQIKDKYSIKIETDVDISKGEITAKYKKVELKPTKIMDIKSNTVVKLNENLNFNSTGLKNSSIIVSSYQFTKSYKYNYQFCYNNKCYDSLNVIDASYKTEKEKTLLVLNYKLILDEEATYYKNITGYRSFFSDFMKIRYIKNKKTLVAYYNNKTPNNLTSTLVLEVDNEIKDADNIFLTFTIRNQEYNIILK